MTNTSTCKPPFGVRYGKPRSTPKVPRKLKKRLYSRDQGGFKYVAPIHIAGSFKE